MNDKRVIKSSDRIKMPWKNGGGITYEIDREPLLTADYDWRLSQAHVDSDGPFSHFSDCDRWLVVWEGAGLILNGTEQGPLKPFHFRGDDQIETTLVNGEIIDVGLIYRRDRVSAEMRVVSGLIGLSKGTHYVISKTVFEVEGVTMNAGDTLKLIVKNQRDIQTPADTLLISIYALSGPQKS